MMRFRVGSLLGIVGLLAALALTASEADARMGSGKSFGNRGSRTFTAPPATRTAPTAQPFDRTMAQPAQPSAARAASNASSTRPGWLNRPGLLGGLAAGFLGAGLLGLLLGHGFFGGLAGLASIIGFLAQIGLIALLGWLVWNWWQRRAQPQAALAGAGPASALRTDMTAAPAAAAATAGSFLHPQRAPSSPSDEIGLVASDYDTFERLLGEIQTAYSAEDMNALRARTTPEMFGYLTEELAENTSRGRVAALSDVKLLQGDLSEAWREGNVEYATVAMRYSLVDQMLDRRTREPIEGAPTPIEVTELWTFMRARGGDWVLSAIQQPEDEQG